MANAAAAAAAATSLADVVVAESPSDSVSSVRWSPAVSGASSDLLCATAWDGSASVWEVSAAGECVPRARFEFVHAVSTGDENSKDATMFQAEKTEDKKRRGARKVEKAGVRKTRERLNAGDSVRCDAREEKS